MTLTVLLLVLVPILLLGGMMRGLKLRVAALETELAALRRDRAHVHTAVSDKREVSRPVDARDAPITPEWAADGVVHALPDTTVAVSPAPAPVSAVSGAAPDPVPPPLPGNAARSAPDVHAIESAPPAGPGLIETTIGRIKDWFTQGNVPVKIGMLVLLAGVAALLRYASDQGWLRLPIELRLAGISVAALAGLAFGWHKRRDKPAFALALQGGAIGVLLLTVFAAMRLYHVLPQGMAFGLSVGLIAGLGVLAVLQDSRTLAILGALAGFLAPIWLSDGSGNHVALFTYYTVLNLAIVTVAWWRSWWILNLLGFVFTWGVGIAWGVLRYEPHLLPTVQPFLIVFFLLYFAIPVFNARKRPARMTNGLDACLLFGTPLIAFAVQAGLLHDRPMLLAYAALALALLYAVSGWWLRHRLQARDIATAHALLAIGFATVLVPLAFPGDPMIVVYALEAAAIVWFCARRQWTLGVLAGLGLLLLAMLKHGYTHMTFGFDAPSAWAFANAGFLTGLAVVGGAIASAVALHPHYRTLARLVYAGGLLYWMALCLREVFAPHWGDRAGDALLLLAIVSGYAAVRAWPHRRDALLGLTGLLGVMAGAVATLVQAGQRGQPLADTGLLAWPLFAAIGWLLLRRMRGMESAWPRITLVAWWLVWAVMFSVAASHWTDLAWLGNGWKLAGMWWPWLAMTVLAVRYWPVFRQPVGTVADAMRQAVQIGLLLLLGLLWLQSLWAAGSAAPLPWIAIVNPLELTQFAVLLVAWAWLSHAGRGVLPAKTRGLILALAGLVWITSLVLHAVHHWGGVPWDSRLFDSSLAQTSLTITWSVLGVAGWIIGSRRGHRGLWLAAAVLMAIVLAKLVLVDRQHLGNLLGIGSFIAYGLLCTVVGYFAPAPPRAPQPEPQIEEKPA